MAGSIQPDYLFKFIIIGDSGVGKTNLFTKFTEDIFRSDSKATIGVQLAIKTFIINKMIVKAQIWDTAGQERFRAITAAYYRSALGVIMVFDLTNSKSFQNISRWYKQLQTYGELNVVVLLIGNKSDLTGQREVRIQTIEELARAKKCMYLETSAATGDNVSKAFNLVVNSVYMNQKAQQVQKKQNQKDKPKLNMTKLNQPNSSIKIQMPKSREQIKKPKDKGHKQCC